MGMLSDKWDSYVLATIPHVPTDSCQYIQTRNAFFAGASIIMGAVNVAGEPHVREEAAIWLLATLEKELNEFVAEIMAKAEQAKKEIERNN